MELSQAHLRPGRILSVEDEKGTVKVCCSGLFSEQDSTDLLPPVYPFNIGNSNTFSSPLVDDEVWVMFFNDNPLELFYIRKDNFPENIQEILSNDYENVEVIVSREIGSGFIQLYFSDGDGWIIRNKDSFIQLRKNGSILIDSGKQHRKIDINDSGISLGSIGQSAHTAVYGDKLYKTLNTLNNMIKTLSKTAKESPYTISLSVALDSLQPIFEASLEDLESPHVTLD